MWYAHFQAAASQETVDYRKEIDLFYNNNIYNFDNKCTYYSVFLFLAKKNKDEWQKYSKFIFVKSIKIYYFKSYIFNCNLTNITICLGRLWIYKII